MTRKSSLMRMYRIMSFIYERHIPVFPFLLQRLLRIFYSIELPPSVVVGRNSYFVHNGLGCVVHERIRIDNNMLVYQNVTLGGGNGCAAPIVGGNVIIGAGACVLGNVSIDDNVKIGANAVVLSDVPDNCTVVGIPARIVKVDLLN